jgi:hypothetical protein
MIALSSRLYRDARIDLLVRQREQMEEEATRLREAKDRFAADLQAERANKPPREGRLRRLIKEPRRTIGGYVRRRRSGAAPGGELKSP